MRTAFDDGLFYSLRTQEAALLYSYGLTEEQIGKLFAAVAVELAFASLTLANCAQNVLGDDALSLFTELRDSKLTAWDCAGWLLEHKLHVIFRHGADEEVEPLLDAVVKLLSDERFTDLFEALNRPFM